MQHEEFWQAYYEKNNDWHFTLILKRVNFAYYFINKKCTHLLIDRDNIWWDPIEKRDKKTFDY